MAEMTNPNTARDKDHRSRGESSIRPTSLSSRRSDDDVIASLANARENRRARQVGEWESRQNVRRAAR